VKLALVAPEEVVEQRKLMLEQQEAVAQEMKISPEILTRVVDVVGAAH
jgi:hypothetical protein